ncbi:MAG: Trk system potassium transporter TrkA [Clostridia bacterium]|nr:Trk system potassium transporter TrkA [Clostridia bacterium]
MKIIIAGCGKIGTTLIENLVVEGHDIVVIDNNPIAISEVTNIYDVMGICGNGVDSDVLMEAGISDAELFIAVAGSDELNMLSCFIAKRMGAKNTIARIRKPEYNDNSLGFMKSQLELSMAINPERLAAQELFNNLKVPSALKIETFSRRNFEMVELRLKEDSLLDGVKLLDIRNTFKAKVLVCCVQRGEGVFIPGGNFVLQSGDRIGITAPHSELQKFFKNIGLIQKKAKSVMILGGSRTAYYLAEMLNNIGSSVKIIDQDEKTCETLCELLPKSVIINGDGAKQEVLLEEGLRSVDAFVALTGMDEENILISIFASSQNVPKVISKVNREELIPMAERLGLESIISTEKLIADVLISYARALQNSLGSNIETLYKLMDGKVEALEFNVRENSRVIGIPLKELSILPNTLIGGIIRDRKTIIPAGDDAIQPGDKVIVIAADHKLQDLSDILRK